MNQSMRIVALVICGLTSISILSTQTVLSQPQTPNSVSSGLIALTENQMTYFNFTVPEAVVDPSLVGHYSVPSGLGIEVGVFDMDECATGSCTSVYYAPNRTSDDVDVSLTPGKTYRLAFLGHDITGERIVETDFHLEYR